MQVLKLIIYDIILLSAYALQFIAAYIDWGNVKPMYLITMFPASTNIDSSLRPINDDDDAAIATKSVTAREPLVLNLESKPMQADMLPGGIEAMDRIFGGNVAHEASFPYQVGFLLQRPKGLYWCGGSLISEEYVLTAAHCVDMAKRALVFLGAHEIKNSKESGQVRLMVHHENFFIFPTWNPKRLKDDIAIVRLPRKIEFTDKIHPIQLPKRSYEHRSFTNKLAIASGWGRYATGVHAISNELRFVKLEVIDGRTCKHAYPYSYHGTNICTSGNFGKSTCNGDSGGPLVLRRKNSNERVLIGITSFGSIFGCDRGFPAAFTKVASYLDWISDVTGIDPHYESSNSMVFDKYLEDYENKVRRYRKRHRDEVTEEEDDEERLKSIHAGMEKFQNAQPQRTAKTTTYRKSKKMQIFIVND